MMDRLYVIQNEFLFVCRPFRMTETRNTGEIIMQMAELKRD